MKKAIVLFTAIVSAAALARADEEQTYLVKRGDSFEELARRFGATPGEIRAANPHAFGIRCLDPRMVQMRDGTFRAHCGRPRYYLIAGKTLTIYKARLLLELENVNLNTRVSALRAELEGLRQERDTLRAERDELASAKREIETTNARLLGQNDELRRANANQPADPAQNREALPTRADEEETESVATIVVLIGLGLCLIALILVHRSRRPLRNLERDRAHLELSRQSVAKEAEDLVGRRRDLDDEEQRRRLALTEGEAELERHRAAVAEQGTKARAGMADLGLAQAKLAEDQISLAGQQAEYAAHTAANEREVKRLDTLRAALESRTTELEEKEHGVEALRQSLAAQRARQNLKDEEQERREADLLRGFDDLTAQHTRLQTELDARRAELDARANAINGKVRMFDEDIQPQIAALALRDAALGRREEAVAGREKAVRTQETDCGLRLEELQEAVVAVEGREAAVTVAEQELERRQYGLANERSAFEQEMAAAREAFAAEVTAAQAILIAAGGLEKAQNILKRASRKKAIAAALDEREAAVAGREEAVARRESACDTREDTLQVWADRLDERERRVAPEELPRGKGPHKTTLPPVFPPPVFPPPSAPGAAVDGVDDENPTVVFPPPPGEEVDPRGTTHVEIEPGPAIDVSKCICAHCGKEVPFDDIAKHESECPGPSKAGQTGP
jgi:hypothetical protein